MTASGADESDDRHDEQWPSSELIPGPWDKWILENKSQLLDASSVENSPYHVFAKTSNCPLQNTARLELELASRFRDPPCRRPHRMVSSTILLFDQVGSAGFESRSRFTCEQLLAIKADFNARYRNTIVSSHVLLRLRHMIGLEVSLKLMNDFQRTQLIVIEELMAPIIDIIGPVLDVAPSVFKQHADASWIPDTHLMQHNLCQSLGRTHTSLTISIKMPRSMRVVDEQTRCKTPTIDERLRSFYPALTQDQKAFVINLDDGEFVYYEHITLHYYALEKKFWKALVLFPPRLRYGDDGRYVVPAKTVQQPLKGVHGLKAHCEARLPNEELANVFNEMEAWVQGFNHQTEGASIKDSPHYVAISLFEFAITHWTTHTADVWAALDYLQGPKMRHKPTARGWELKYTMASDDSRQVTRHQVEFAKNLKSLMLQDLLLLDEVVETLQNLIEAGGPSNIPEVFREGLAQSSKGLFRVFASMKKSIVRQLPTIEDYIHRFIINEQSQAAQSQRDSSIQNTYEAKLILGITVLAVFYVPIQTASSFFSMNIKEMSNGTELWIASLTIVLLTAVTVFLVLALRLEWHKQIERILTWLRKRLKPDSLNPPLSDTPTFKEILRSKYYYALACVEIKYIDRIRTAFTLRREVRMRERAFTATRSTPIPENSTQSTEIPYVKEQSSNVANGEECVTPSQLETAIGGADTAVTFSETIKTRVAVRNPWDTAGTTSSEPEAAARETLFANPPIAMPPRPWWQAQKSAKRATAVQAAFSEIESAKADLEVFEFSVTGFNESEKDKLKPYHGDDEWERVKERETRRRMNEAVFRDI